MNFKKPFFSIVTPFYNSNEYIEKFISKLKEQTYTNWECLLIDDYSTDLSERLIEKLIIEDERFRFYKNELKKDKKSPYQARNFGLLKSRGEYISFLDIDDYWDKNMLLIKFNLLSKDNTIDLIFTDYKRVYPNNKTKYVSPIKFINYKTQLKIHNPIGMLTSTIKNTLIREHKFKNIYHEDFVFWSEIINNNPNIRIKNIPLPLAFYRISKNSLSSKKFVAFLWHYQCYRLIGYSKFFSFLSMIPLLLIKVYIWFLKNN